MSDRVNCRVNTLRDDLKDGVAKLSGLATWSLGPRLGGVGDEIMRDYSEMLGMLRAAVLVL